MSDYSEIKSAALAATQGVWVARADGWTIRAYPEARIAGDGIKVVHTCSAHMQGQGKTPDIEQQVANQHYIEQTQPSVVLGMISEIERYREYGCDTCDGSGHLHRADGEYFGDCKSCGSYELEQAKREREQLKAENEALKANASLLELLPELDEALEDLEIHGQHSDQGYRKLKDWYRKVSLACDAIDAAMSKEAQS